MCKAPWGLKASTGSLAGLPQQQAADGRLELAVDKPSPPHRLTPDPRDGDHRMPGGGGRASHESRAVPQFCDVERWQL
ncbi:hypothetical protein GCM10010507_10190 [Streptomyces cinnamoneus]|uniref:Uncharacterized protein n=1 Tax=Streptomyces cinnamoneus TaxID=53446 RepID=A0A918WFJ3_STRCJ|nr:hypothetical protein GCM10010507_10190 [Streptomyces cinnamoneus]